MQAHGYDEDSFIPSQVSGEKATQIHHVIYLSQGGSDEADNLIALTYAEHEGAHFRGKKENWLQREELQEIVNLHLNTHQ